jgi:hypothetical protein
MNARLFFCIALGVFTAHIGVFMLLSHLRPGPKRVLPPAPNFSAKAATVVDPETGEKTTYREITVSTKLAPRSPQPPPETPRLAEPVAP